MTLKCGGVKVKSNPKWKHFSKVQIHENLLKYTVDNTDLVTDFPSLHGLSHCRQFRATSG